MSRQGVVVILTGFDYGKIPMVTMCPLCKTSVGFKHPGHLEAVKLRCSSCKSLFRIVRKIRHNPSPLLGTKAPVRVLVAKEQKVFCSAVAKVLAGGEFDLVFCHDGNSALEAITRLKPDVAVIDVALPGMFGFEVCEAVRRDSALDSVKLILITAVYDKRRYVSPSASLYGADVHIEQHMIAGSLESLIRQLVPPVLTPVPRISSASCGMPASHDLQEPLPVVTAHTEQAPVISPSEQQNPEHKKAQRLARLIVSDIALYNRDLVEQGAQNGTLYELLADDIREGKSLYERRIPEDIRRDTSYLDDAFSELIAKKLDEIKRR